MSQLTMDDIFEVKTELDKKNIKWESIVIDDPMYVIRYKKHIKQIEDLLKENITKRCKLRMDLDVTYTKPRYDKTLYSDNYYLLNNIVDSDADEDEYLEVQGHRHWGDITTLDPHEDVKPFIHETFKKFSQQIDEFTHEGSGWNPQ